MFDVAKQYKTHDNTKVQEMPGFDIGVRKAHFFFRRMQYVCCHELATSWTGFAFKGRYLTN